MAAISIYISHLKADNYPISSSVPPTLVTPSVQNEEALAAKRMIVELSHKIHAVTVDPELYLYISTLQVPILPSEHL
jgi:hypothetical protein